MATIEKSLINFPHEPKSKVTRKEAIRHLEGLGYYPPNTVRNLMVQADKDNERLTIQCYPSFYHFIPVEPLEDEEQEDPCLHGNTGECQECWEFENYYCKGTPHEHYD